MTQTRKAEMVLGMRITVKRILIPKTPYTEESKLAQKVMSIRWGRLSYEELDVLRALVGSLR